LAPVISALDIGHSPLRCIVSTKPEFTQFISSMMQLGMVMNKNPGFSWTLPDAKPLVADRLFREAIGQRPESPIQPSKAPF
jgi:hypothetical protein